MHVMYHSCKFNSKVVIATSKLLKKKACVISEIIVSEFSDFR